MYKELFKNKDFLFLSIGGFVSGIGDYMYNIALTLTLYNITESIGPVALMWLSRAILRIPIQYLSGIIADKFNKKHIIILTNLISIFIAISFIFAKESLIWLAYISAFLLQSLNDIDETAESALLPEIVSSDELAEANSVFSILNSISLFLSPALAGIIYKFYGGTLIFIIDALTFFIASIFFYKIKYTFTKTNVTTKNHGILKSGIEGLKIISHYSEVKNMFIIVSLFGLAGRFYEVYKVAIADELLNIQSEGIIYFDYAFAIGGLIAPFIIKLLSNYPQRKVFIIISILISLGYIIFGFTPYFIITFITLTISGVLHTCQGIYSRLIIQKNIPKEYIGRVFAFYKIILTFFAIIGLCIAPISYSTIGAGYSFLIISVITIILCLLQLRRNPISD